MGTTRRDVRSPGLARLALLLLALVLCQFCFLSIVPIEDPVLTLLPDAMESFWDHARDSTCPDGGKFLGFAHSYTPSPDGLPTYEATVCDYDGNVRHVNVVTRPPAHAATRVPWR